MKYLLMSSLVFFICFCSSVHAKKCSYEIKKTDEFSGKMVKTTKATLAKSWKILFSMNGDVYGVGLYLLLPGEINTAINKGDSLLIKLTGNEIIKLVSENDVPPRSYVAGTGAGAAIVTDFSPIYKCTKQDLEKIGKEGVSVVRVFIGPQFMEVSVKKELWEKIAKAANCIVE